MSLKGKLQRYRKYVATTSEQRSSHSYEGKEDIQEQRQTLVINQRLDEIPDQVQDQTQDHNSGELNRLGVDSSEIVIPYTDHWQELQCTTAYHGSEWLMRREVVYPLSHKHGKNTFSELNEVVERWNERKINHPLSAYSRSSEDLLFFDTETTGLGGGVGNTIFLLGYGQIKESTFTVTQLFLPSPASEMGFYYHFLEDVQEKKHLVTYNGKAFDWPQVKTRHTLLRKELQQLPSFGHYDLLHAARRLWKHSLPSCRLSIVEEQILDFHRVEDTPGYMAPILYFDYLRSKDPRTLSGVFYHNEWDICSLVTLYVHISMMLLEEDNVDSSLCSSKELIELGRWYESVGELDLAICNYQKAIQLGSGDDIQAKHLLAYVYKRRKEVHFATKLWEDVSERSDFCIETNIELAKLYEHVYKDYEKALFYTGKAQYNWQRIRKRGTQSADSKMKEELLSRVKRLERKIEGLKRETDNSLFG